MRVGVFGGTFDPIHLGHLILAELCRDQGQLEQVWFVPAFRPPNKWADDLTRFDQRVEMIALAIAGNPAFRIDELEKERAGPSYTVETLARLQKRHPQAELWLLLGGDSLADLPSWYDPIGVVSRAGLMVMERPGYPMVSTDQLRPALGLPADAPLRLQQLDAPRIDIASRELRRAITMGRSVRYQVPRAVDMYIHDKQLYAAR
jgi:nicotinate-nucleotide adenylyltransferase